MSPLVTTVRGCYRSGKNPALQEQNVRGWRSTPRRLALAVRKCFYRAFWPGLSRTGVRNGCLKPIVADVVQFPGIILVELTSPVYV